MAFNLVFSRRYSMAHRLISGNSQKCATPHGHNEVVVVQLAPTFPCALDQRNNMVAEFAKVKSIWHQWIDGHVDHAFQLSDGDPLVDYFRDLEADKVTRLLITPGDPTTEMLAVCFMSKVNTFLRGSGLICVEVAIEETPTNTVTFTGNPIDHLGLKSAWWNRPDFSINDL